MYKVITTQTIKLGAWFLYEAGYLLIYVKKIYPLPQSRKENFD
jgi:hypothetical protein